MGNILQRVKKIISKGPPVSLDELRETFRKKYHAFRMLLASNNAALHLMTELELALHGNQSFGMTFIRSHATASASMSSPSSSISTNWTADKYASLVPVFTPFRGGSKRFCPSGPPLP